MVEKLSCEIADVLVDRKYVINEKKAIYEFHILMLIEKTITVVSILIISLITDAFLQTIVIGVSFLSLRKRTGGFHANTFSRCYLLSLITYVISIKVLYPILKQLPVPAILIIVFCVGVIAFFIGTVNHPNLDLEECELNISKKKARKIIVLELSIAMICTIFVTTRMYGISICMALMSCTMGMLLAKLIKQEIRKGDEKT